MSEFVVVKTRKNSYVQVILWLSSWIVTRFFYSPRFQKTRNLGLLFESILKAHPIMNIHYPSHSPTR